MPEGENLGTAYASIEISTEGVAHGLNTVRSQFNRTLDEVGQQVERLGQNMSRLGESLTILTSPLTIFGATGIKVAADFDEAMTQISARTGIVGDDLNRISEFAQKMGADTVFSSQQAADAMLNLLTSGQSVEQAMATLPSVMQAAAASGEDLGRTADTLTTIMAAYGLQVDRLPAATRELANSLGVTNEMLVEFSMQGDEIDEVSPAMEKLAQSMGMTAEEFYRFLNRAEDASTVVESLSRAAGATKTDMSSLGQAFANVGPVAKNFGISVDQTAAILGIFAQNGIEGAEAGTQLKSMLLNMSQNTEKTQNAWSKLGVSMYDAQGNMRNINTVMIELDTALDKLPVQEQNELMQTLAGSYGIVGLSALRSGVAISDMQKMMEDQASAAEVADAMMGTFKNTLGSLGGSVESLQIAVFTPFMNEVLQPLAEQAIEIVNRITDWIKVNPDLVSQIVKVAAVVAGLGPVLLIAGKAISAIGAIIGILSSPITLIIAAIAALVWAFENNFAGIRDFLQPIIDQIGIGIGRLVESIGWFISDIQEFGIGEAILNAFGLGASSGGESWIEGVLVSFGMARETAVAAVDFIGQALQGFIEFIQSTVIPGLQQLANWFIQDALPAVVNFIQTVVIPGIQQLFTFLGEAWAIIQPALEAMFNWFVSEGLPAIVNFVQTVVIPGIQQFIQTLVDIWAMVQPALTSLFNWFVTEALPAIIAFINDTVIPGIQVFIDLLVGIWTAIQPGLQSMFDWFVTTALPGILAFITDTVIPGVQTFIDILIQIWEAVSPVIIGLVDWFSTTGWPIIQGIIETVIVPVVQGMIDILKGIWEVVGPVIAGLLDWFQVNGWPLIKGVIDGAVKLVGDFITALSNIWNAVQAPLNTFKDGIAAIFNWLVTNVIQPVIDAIGGIITTVQNAVNAIAGLNTTGQGAGGLFGSGIGPDFDPIGGLRDILGFRKGGYTGDGNPNEPAGVAHKGEWVVPENGALVLRDSGNGDSQAGMQFAAGAIVINASTYEGGRAAAKGFADQLEELRRSRG